MKKTATLLTVSALILALSACGNSAPAATTTIASEQPAVTTTNSDKSGSTAGQTTATDIEVATTTTATTTQAINKPEFSQNATIPETVLVDEGGVKVTATGLTYSRYSASVELTIENNTDHNIGVMSGTLGYGCNSVNGMMVSGGYFNCDVAAGKKAKETASFNYDELLLYGITEIADIELGIYSQDDDYNYTYYPVSLIKTSAADSYKYDDSAARNNITSTETQIANGYTVQYFSEDKLYDEGGISIVSEIVFENKDGEPMLLIEAKNNTAEQVYLSTSNFFVNGIKVYSSRWSGDLINPDKTAMIDIKLNSLFDKRFWETYGITQIENIRFDLEQSDRDGKKLTDPVTVNIAISSGNKAVDSSGNVVYDENGVRMVLKGIFGGKSDYDKSMYVMLLAENKSGKTLSFDDAYDSFSINGFMADSYISSTTLNDGEYAVWKIEIPERSLEDCGIKSKDDIEEIEFKLELRDKNYKKQEGTVLIKAK